MEILEYKVVEKNSPYSLANTVNSMLNRKINGEKWIPQGGLSHYHKGITYYSQAMIRIKVEEKKEEVY